MAEFLNFRAVGFGFNLLEYKVVPGTIIISGALITVFFCHIFFYKKVCVNDTDLSTFVEGYAWQLICQVSHGCYMKEPISYQVTFMLPMSEMFNGWQEGGVTGFEFTKSR